MGKDIKLKTAFMLKNKTQREVSRKTGICETVISKAVCGRYVLTEDEKQKLAAELGFKPEELFSSE